MEALTEDEQRTADVLVQVGHRRADAERMVKEYNAPDETNENARRVNDQSMVHGGA